MSLRRYFRSLSYGWHEPGGICLWWLVETTRRLHIISELAFEQKDAEELAPLIKKRDEQLLIRDISYTVGTPQIVSTQEEKPGFSGETIGDRLAYYGVIVIPADDDLLNGWARCQSLLRKAPDGEPWLTIDPSCQQLVRAIPAGLREDKAPDEIQSPSPALTAFRYGAMSPLAPAVPARTIEYPVGTAGYYMQKNIREHASLRRRRRTNRF